MMVTNLVLINVAVYIVQLFFEQPNPQNIMDRPIEWYLGLHRDLFSSDTLTQPWKILGLVTSGFVHSRNNILHILGNMICLWFFGRAVEEKHGRRQFLWFYLTGIIFAGLVWIAAGYLPTATGTYAVGASGGVTAVVILFALEFPKRIVYFWGVLPVPAWVLGAVWVVMDLSGAAKPADNIAYEAHIGGAIYALLYWQTGLSLGRLIPSGLSLASLKRGPKLKVHDPDEYEEAMSSEVDDILRKIKEQGQESLTAKERRILERASRRYQQKHR
jgi:membrane associated rhomboid family serine protease